jgi:uncharacterized membrane protein
MIPLLVIIGTIVVIAVSAIVIHILRVKITGKAEKEDSFNWRLLVYAAVGTLILFSPVMIYGGDSDFLYIILMVLFSIILIITVMVLAFFKQRGTVVVIFSILLTNWVLSWCLLKNVDALHGFTQWHLHSNKFRTQLMAQSDPANGEFKHIEWDVSGYAGNETIVYLVFDPNDSLSAEARSHSSGKFSGIPCEVDRIHRLESHYYTVVFYTETGWDSCNF